MDEQSYEAKKKMLQEKIRNIDLHLEMLEKQELAKPEVQRVYQPLMKRVMVK